MQTIRILCGLVFVIAGLAGCAISAESAVFDQQRSAKIEGAEGEYFLYDPWEKHFNEELVASVRDGELELVNVEECRKGETCFWKAVVVRLSSTAGSYVVQLPVDDDDEDVFYVFVERLGDYGVACFAIDEDRHGQHIERIRYIAAESGLETESRKYKPVFITGNPEPERVEQFLDEVWSKVPLVAWSCYGLIPDGKPVRGFIEAYSKTTGGVLPWKQ